MSPAPASRRRGALLLAVLCLVAVAAASLLFGRYPRPGFTSPASLASDPMARAIVLSMRLPRVLAAMLLGAVLGASGCAFQLVFANPLVDAGFLGVSQGASFGAALVLVLGGGPLALFAGPFAAALLALALSAFMASRIRFGGAVLRLILSGLAVSAFFSALVALIKYGADPLRVLPEITYWLMGGLSQVSWRSVAMTAPIALVSVTGLLLQRWRVSILSLDEAAASSLGVNPRAARAVTLGLAAAGVASVTAMAGVVSWVGLVVPHMTRVLLGSDGEATVPGSAIVGALFVVLCDTISRSLFSGELPLGVTTALVGTLAFFALLLGRGVKVERG